MISSKTFIVLDFKTTGFSASSSIVSCSIVDQNGNVILDNLVKSSNYNHVLPIEGFHCINEEDIRERGISEVELFAKLSEIFEQYPYIVIYNAEFDKKFIPQNIKFQIPIYCAMDISIGFINQHPSYQSIGQYLKLNCLASLLDVNTMDLDLLTSLGDAELCRRVWVEMLKPDHHLEIPFDDIITQYEHFKSEVYYDL